MQKQRLRIIPKRFQKWGAESPWLYIGLLVLWGALLYWVDKKTFKQNDRFNVRHILSSDWDGTVWAPPMRPEVQAILKQKFSYLARGMHAFAFLSEDGRYVLKFHRYPSHMRIFPWLNHPFSQKSEKRIKIRANDLKKWQYHLNSYQNSFSSLKEETGIIYASSKAPISEVVTIIDKEGSICRVPLSRTTFILQHKADLIYPSLDYEGEEMQQKIVAAIIELMVTCCKKGFVDQDPILRKNYGILRLGEQIKAIHIDVGDMVFLESVKSREAYIPYVKEITASLRQRIERDYPHLLSYYHQVLDERLSKEYL